MAINVYRDQIQHLREERAAITEHFFTKSCQIDEQPTLKDRISLLGHLYVDLQHYYANYEKIIKLGMELYSGLFHQHIDLEAAVSYAQCFSDNRRIKPLDELAMHEALVGSVKPFLGDYVNQLLAKASLFIPENLISEASQLSIKQISTHQELFLEMLKSKGIEEKDYEEFEKVGRWVHLLVTFLPQDSQEIQSFQIIAFLFELQKINLGQSYITFSQKQAIDKTQTPKENFLDLAQYRLSSQQMLENNSEIAQKSLDFHTSFIQEMHKARLSCIPEVLEAYPQLAQLFQSIPSMEKVFLEFSANAKIADTMKLKMDKCLKELNESPDNIEIYFNYLEFIHAAYSTYLLGVKQILTNKMYERVLNEALLIQAPKIIKGAICPAIKQGLKDYYRKENEDIIQVFCKTGIGIEPNQDDMLMMTIAHSDNVKGYIELVKNLIQLSEFQSFPLDYMHSIKQMLMQINPKSESSLEEDKDILEKIADKLDRIIFYTSQNAYNNLQKECEDLKDLVVRFHQAVENALNFVFTESELSAGSSAKKEAYERRMAEIDQQLQDIKKLTTQHMENAKKPRVRSDVVSQLEASLSFLKF